MNFSITGDQECMKLFEEISEVEVKKVLNEIGDTVVNKMKADIAVDTANAQHSIDKHLKRVDGGWGVTIYPSTRYYYYQEVGTSKDRKNIGRLLGAIVDTQSQCFEIAKKVLDRK